VYLAIEAVVVYRCHVPCSITRYLGKSVAIRGAKGRVAVARRRAERAPYAVTFPEELTV